MNRLYTVRFDDICPTMNWKQFQRAVELMDSYHVKPLIGVIPFNKDPEQIIDQENLLFWDIIRGLQEKGWEIALHGYTHVYNQHNPKTLLCGKKHSEFAGNSYEKQVELIRRGKDELLKNGISTDIFFAPAHTYDINTIRALYDNGFRYMSDGMSSRPYRLEGIIHIPCRSFGIPGKLVSKYNTAVCHTNEWESRKKDDYEQLRKYCELHKDELVDYSVLKKLKCGNLVLEKIDEYLYINILKFKNILSR